MSLEAQPQLAPHDVRGGSFQPLEKEALRNAADTLYESVRKVLPTVAPFRLLNEAITADPIGITNGSGTIGDDRFAILHRDGYFSVSIIETRYYDPSSPPSTIWDSFRVQSGEQPAIHAQSPFSRNSQAALDSARRQLDKLARYSNVPESELPLDMKSRRNIAATQRVTLAKALGIVHPDIDLSGKTTEEQQVDINPETRRTIKAESNALTLTTTKTATSGMSQTIQISLDDSGVFTFKDTFKLSDEAETRVQAAAENSVRAQGLIIGVFANILKEASRES